MDKACQNHNRVIWRQDMQDPMDPGNYYAPSIFVVGESAIGIDVGGRVHVMDVREWAAQVAEIARLRAKLEQARAEIVEWRNMAVKVADQIEKSAGVNSAGYAQYVRDCIETCETILADRKQAERGQE